VRLILSSKNLNKNTGLFHLAGIELAPSQTHHRRHFYVPTCAYRKSDLEILVVKSTENWTRCGRDRFPSRLAEMWDEVMAHFSLL